MSQHNVPLAPLLAPELAPLFRRPTRNDVESAWYSHVPFAHWIIGAARPGCVVELGAHNGVSYSAFCDAVLAERLDTRCYAVDTWRGDDHAGFYDEQVFRDLNRFHQSRYAGFSELIRATFDEALPYIPDGSVDLLHIDGRHGYDDVRHDFASWQIKLSRRAVVLFHDTNVRERDFGVFRLWAELSQQHKSFEFLHGHGLGVLAHGDEIPAAVAALCGLNQPADINAVRERFALLGERWVFGFDFDAADRHARQLRRVLDETKAAGERAQAEVNKLVPAYQSMAAANRNARTQLAETRYALAVAERQIDETTEALRVTEAARLAAEEARLAAETAKLNADEARLISETTAAAAEMERSAFETKLLAAEARRKMAEDEAAMQGERSRMAQAAACQLMAERTILLNSRSWRLASRAIRLAALVSRRETMPIGLQPITTGLEFTPEPAPVPELPPQLESEPTPAAWPEPEPAVPEPAAAEPAPSQVAAPAPAILFISGEPHTPGHFYRVERAVEAAASLGWDAAWTEAGPVNFAALQGKSIVVLWRVPYSAHIQGIIDVSHQLGATVVFDVDDLMFKPELATVEVIDGIRSQRFAESSVKSFFATILQTMQKANVVICPTAELASHIRRIGKPAFVLPNGFDAAGVAASRKAVRIWRDCADGLRRIGYAAGSRTHQKDFSQAVTAIAQVLRERTDTRLVMFRDPASGEGVVLTHEFEALAPVATQIEWRDMVRLEDLPRELARFDINIAPLEPANPFCDAKSELKYFEAALVGVPTIASPVGPFVRAIEPGVTGYLAADEADWHEKLVSLLDDRNLRRRVGRAAYHDVLWRFGPHRRGETLRSLFDQIEGAAPAARAFQLDLLRDTTLSFSRGSGARIRIPEAEILLQEDRLGDARVTVIIPVYNYADYVVEALRSVYEQSLTLLDLVVIDDASTDDSVAMVMDWARANGERFNRIQVLRHKENSGLGFARNSGFTAAETPFVLPLDADNRLRPQCCEALAGALERSSAAFAYPAIRQFGDGSDIFGREAFSALRLMQGNYVDAMALIHKWAWAAAGGYDHVKFGWEDYDFWCRLIELGLWGLSVPSVMADYRVHRASMLHTTTEIDAHKQQLLTDLQRRHGWLDITSQPGF